LDSGPHHNTSCPDGSEIQSDRSQGSVKFSGRRKFNGAYLSFRFHSSRGLALEALRTAAVKMTGNASKGVVVDLPETRTCPLLRSAGHAICGRSFEGLRVRSTFGRALTAVPRWLGCPFVALGISSPLLLRDKKRGQRGGFLAFCAALCGRCSLHGQPAPPPIRHHWSFVTRFASGYKSHLIVRDRFHA